MVLLRIIHRVLCLLDLVLYTIWLYILSFLPKILLKSYPKKFQRWCRLFCHAFGVTLQVHEQYVHDLPTQYIVIANHPSLFEDIGMPAVFAARFLSKHEVQHWWIGGRIATAAGTIYFDREDKAARKQARIDLAEALKAGANVGLYPEGGCKGRRIFQPFTYGAFDLAIETDIPIVPVFIYYEAQATFEWQHQSILKKIWQIFNAHNHHAHYYIFNPIYPKQFKHRDHLKNHVEELYLQWQKRFLE